ncbi:folate family ECF transporter S component [Sedimentibacter sp. zth1]|uniref:folate family ECF transporter S component n=1 Tax=Sedimentibacter sp. zth1 TaxID=2816908 RepID=UPI001A920F7F|nr:folate family ECF transporter S component [Sedimentibacter sp. zth1]QSX05301.1 folate family ECF transporter S component [Sedimentibacter sp. zth1]
MKGNTFLVSKKITTRKLTTASILIAMSLVLNLLFLFYIPVAGFQAVKITFSTAITMITGIICGPMVGFISGSLVDILTCLIKPVGPYFPGFTIAAGLSGLIPGLFFKYFKSDKLNYNLINTIFISILSASCVGGFIFKGLLTIEGNSLYYNGEPLHIALIIGYIVLTLAYIVFPIIVTKKFHSKYKTNKILFMVSVSQFITSIILNTYFLSIIMGKGFIVFLPARILSNFFLIPIYAIVISTVLETVNKTFKLKF